MKAVYADALGLDDPFDGLQVGDRPEPRSEPGWTIVRTRAASLNRHDLWTLAGVTLVPVEPPVILGCDGAGMDPLDRPVVIYPVLGHGVDFHMLSDGVDGTLAPLVRVPVVNMVRMPRNLSFDEAACLGTAWLTAWSSLVGRAGLRAGERVLVQGATGGLSNAAISLAAALGAEVVASSRSKTGRDLATELGAHEVIETGEPVRCSVDVVLDSSGADTWEHSLHSLGVGGRLVSLGATTGPAADAGIRLIFRKDLEIYGNKMGTLEEFRTLCDFVEMHDLHPYIGRVVVGLDAAPGLLRQLSTGELVGKGVVVIDAESDA